MNNFDKAYNRIMKNIITEGAHSEDRIAYGTFAIKNALKGFAPKYILVYLKIKYKLKYNDIGNSKANIEDIDIRDIRFDHIDQFKNWKIIDANVDVSKSFKEFLTSNEVKEFSESIDEYGKPTNSDKYAEHKDNVYSSFKTFIKNDCEGDTGIAKYLNEAINKKAASDVKDKQYAKEYDNRREEELRSQRRNEEIMWGNESNELEFSHWFKGKDDKYFRLTGARFEAHMEDDSFDYEYGSERGVYHNGYDVEIDSITWFYEDKEGNSGEVENKDLKKTLGLDSNDPFVDKVIEWIMKNYKENDSYDYSDDDR